jgi:hypothetical protein
MEFDKLYKNVYIKKSSASPFDGSLEKIRNPESFNMNSSYIPSSISEAFSI